MVFILQVFAFFITFSLLGPTSAQQLSAVRVSASLPTPRTNTAASYDGMDSIYILGGYNGRQINDILKYSISSDTIQLVANLPFGVESGSTSVDRDGNIYYLGGWKGSDSADIIKFSPSTNFVETLNVALPQPNSYSGAVKENPASDRVVLFGGDRDPSGIVVFDTDTMTTRRVSSLPKDNYYASAVSDQNGSAYVFGGSNAESRHITKVNLTTFESTVSPSNPDINLPFTTAAVWDDNRNVTYIIGGYEGSAEVDTASILQFNPETMNYVVIPVSNFPTSGTDMFESPSAVFVPSLDRIYFSGGRASRYFDSIWYIQLPTSNASDNL